MEITVKPNVGKGNRFKGVVKVKGSDPYRGNYVIDDCVVTTLSDAGDVTLRVHYSDCGGAFNTTTVRHVSNLRETRSLEDSRRILLEILDLFIKAIFRLFY